MFSSSRPLKYMLLGCTFYVFHILFHDHISTIPTVFQRGFGLFLNFIPTLQLRPGIRQVIEALDQLAPLQSLYVCHFHGVPYFFKEL